MFHGKSLVVGVEDTDDGLLKVYLGARWKNIYTLVEPGDEANEVRRLWANPTQHVLVPTPPADCIYEEG